jgi:hemolysin type calcium-binding protein
MAITSEQQSDILKVVAGLFNAAPGGSNLTDLARQVEGGVTVAELADALAVHPIFTNDVMAGKVTTSAQVGVLMDNFGLTADGVPGSAGTQAAAYFASQIVTGVGFGAIVYEAVTFLSGTVGPEFVETQTLLNNKVLVAEAYSATTSSNDLATLQNVLSNVTGTAPFTPDDVAAALADSGSAIGTGDSFILTTGVDNLTGASGNDTFTGTFDNAATGTFGVADEINGGGGTADRLNIVATADDGTAVLPAATVSGVEIINVRNVDGDATPQVLTVSGSNFLDYTALNADRSTDSVTFTDVAAGASVGVIGNGNTTNGILDATYAAAATAPVLNIINGTVGTTGTIAITAAGADSFTINSHGAANAVGAITAPASATSLIVNAATGLAVDTGITAAGATSLTVSGAASTDAQPTVAGGSTSAVSLGAVPGTVTTIDASGLTAGGLGTTLIAGITSFLGGQGNDSVTSATLTATVDSQIDAGEGTADRLTIAAAANVAGTKANEYANFEILDIVAETIDVSLFTNSVFTGAMIGGAGTFANLSAAQAANVTVYADSTGVYGVKDATVVGQLDTLTLNIDDSLAAMNTLTLGNITAAGVETININAVDDATVDLLTGAAALTAMNITGAGDVSVTTGLLTLNVNTVVDASAVTGAVTFDASLATANGIAIKGTTGTEVNTLTGTILADAITAGAGDDVIDGNAGADIISGGDGVDTFMHTAGDSVASTAQVFAGANVAAGDTITFGSGVDVINDFTAGASGDIFDGALAAAVPTTGIGVAHATGFVAGTWFLSGAWNGSTFTAAADGTGADTLIVEGDVGADISADTDVVILVGVDSDDFVAANFA